MATPLPTQRPVARPSAQSKPSSLNLALLVLLLATIGVGGYGWVKLDGRVAVLEKKGTPVATNPRTPAAQPGPTTNFNANQNGRGGRGGRGGGAANTAQRLGLDLTDAQLTSLDQLTSTRNQMMRDDPTADFSGIDGQIADIVGPENLASFTFAGGRGQGRGGRGGAGGPGGGFGGAGGPGGGGGGGFGGPGGGGGFGGGAGGFGGGGGAAGN